jgi:chemotaxis protein CheX
MAALSIPRLVTLPEILESTAAAQLASELRSLNGHPVEIDAHAVGRISTLCIQVLLSAAVTWVADCIAFRIFNPSDAFLQAIHLLGLVEEQFAIERNAA